MALSIIERACELATSGHWKSLEGIESALSKEGYASVHVHFRSPSLRKDFLTLIKVAIKDAKSSSNIAQGSHEPGNV